MRQDWIFHDSHSNLHRSPFGAVSCNEKISLRLDVQSAVKPDAVMLKLVSAVNGEMTVPMELKDIDGEKRGYYVSIQAPSAPGLLWYYFAVAHGDTTLFYGNNPESFGGVGAITNYVPPMYQITVFKEGTATPDWFKEAVMYQIFVDRFCNGNKDGDILNPKKGSLLHADWHDKPLYVREPETGKILAYDFFGGNLKGVITKLPYLKDLGVDVIYLNPIFEAPSNHKYDTGDYKKIDPMFGDNQIFAELCSKAKELGIEIILDGVFSHTGSDSIYFNKDENYPGLGAYQSKESPYYPWYRFEHYPDRYESWWGIETLPNINELEPSYLKFIMDDEDSVLKYWMKLGAKGWRLDVVDELPEEFVKRFTAVMKAVDPESVLIGEVWEDASRKVSYGKLREYLWGDELDSAMNYPFRKILLEFILGEKDARFTHNTLMSLYENYPLEHFYSMMNLLGSHDVPRVLTLLSGAPPESTMTKSEQRRYSLTQEQRELGVARLKLLSLWQMTFPGVPCVYYGDEVGMEGYNDPLNRGTYPWGREDLEVLNWYKKIIELRKQHDVLRSGEWLPIYAAGDVYGYLRKIEDGQGVLGKPGRDDVAVILLNRSTKEEVSLTIDLRRWCGEVLFDALEDRREIVLDEGYLNIVLKPLDGKLFLQATEIQPTPDRGTGILLHPTSLPSSYGIGDLGPQAYSFVDFLINSNIKMWQILPLNPVDYYGSPYQSSSAFAGNQLLISPDILVERGLLSEEEAREASIAAEKFPIEEVQYHKVSQLKEKLFKYAFKRFKEAETPPVYKEFLANNRNWLEDYALFMALKEHFGGKSWNLWNEPVAFRDERALEEYSRLLENEIAYHCFLQYVFYTQWMDLKNYANQNGICIIGDLPIFVAHDSSDVWANRRFFELDEQGQPIKVAGVPPDYFSPAGQLWGNPHYNWEEMASDEYGWWRERIICLSGLVDIIRIDHFRGFEAYWEVPAGEETAVNGRWVQGPGARFFDTIKKYLGELPFIAEDLGFITPEVRELKNRFGFPGMKILQFTLEDSSRKFLPKNYIKNTVIYTGTHDNNTICGWYNESLINAPDMIRIMQPHIEIDADASLPEICWRFIEVVLGSRADKAIIPLQDVLCLGSEARMNRPGTTTGNWNWRFRPDSLTSELALKLAGLIAKYKR